MFAARTTMVDFVDTMLKVAKEATAVVAVHADDDDSDLDELEKTLDELESELLPTPSK